MNRIRRGRPSALIASPIAIAGPEGAWTTGLSLVLSLIVVGCQDEYPIAATFCDDFCHATIPSGCPYEPENCVRDCELWRVRTECRVGLDDLLGCYQQASPDAFVCRGRGDAVVVRDGVCETERDQLLTCQLPDMSECLEPCRQLQQLADIAAASDVVMPAAGTPAVGGAEVDQCPLIEQSCESICWNVLTVGDLEVVAGLDTAPSPGGEPMNAGDAGAPLWAEVVRLVSERCGVQLPL